VEDEQRVHDAHHSVLHPLFSMIQRQRQANGIAQKHDPLQHTDRPIVAHICHHGHTEVALIGTAHIHGTERSNPKAAGSKDVEGQKEQQTWLPRLRLAAFQHAAD